jgi:hypothetical protein
MGLKLPQTMFALAFDERRPNRVATNGGDVYTNLDGGESWTTLKLPPAAHRFML